MQCASPSPRGIFLTPHTSSACLLCVNGATKGFLGLICMSSINKFLAFFQSLLFPAYGPSQVTVHLFNSTYIQSEIRTDRVEIKILLHNNHYFHRTNKKCAFQYKHYIVVSELFHFTENLAQIGPN